MSIATSRIAVVIRYQSRDETLLPHVLRECRHFAAAVGVVGDEPPGDGPPGEPPGEPLGEPPCEPLVFVRDPAAWLAGLGSGVDYVLFLESHEVPDGQRFGAFAARLPPDAGLPFPMRMATWWYFRYPWLRSLGVEDRVVLAPRAGLTSLCRDDVSAEPVRRRVRDADGQPMFHDYSWARTPLQLVDQVRGNGDADWQALLARELARFVDPIVGARHRDLVFGKTCVVVEPRLHIPLFTHDWHAPAAAGMLAGCEARRTGDEGRPAILEVGSWEGRSAAWFLRTFPEGHLTCVDTFEGPSPDAWTLLGLEQRFRHNMWRCTRLDVRVGPSRRELLGLVPESFDIVYVDGSHEAADVLGDLVMCWALLRPGGVLLCDDYRGPFAGVTAAADAFLACVGDAADVLRDDYQLHLRKHLRKSRDHSRPPPEA